MEHWSLAGFITGYFLPWIIALLRKHRNAGAICMLNALLGWTLVGWLLALIWSMTCNVKGK